jgi:hypothetical protein
MTKFVRVEQDDGAVFDQQVPDDFNFERMVEQVKRDGAIITPNYYIPLWTIKRAVVMTIPDATEAQKRGMN